MSKDKTKVHAEHKELLHQQARDIVANPDDHLDAAKVTKEQMDEFKKGAEKHPEDTEKAVYKVLKKEAEAQLNNDNLHEDDHKLHLWDKLKNFAGDVAEFLHKLIEPFIPVLTNIASEQITAQVMANEKIPEEYKAQLASASQAAVGKIGEGISNLDFADDNAQQAANSDEVSASGDAGQDN